MAKKRKTRKQKEIASLRHNENIHVHFDKPSYSVKAPIAIDKKPVLKLNYDKKDTDYLKHDIVSITAATGIVAAFEILLFVLLTSGVIRLNVLGY